MDALCSSNHLSTKSNGLSQEAFPSTGQISKGGTMLVVGLLLLVVLVPSRCCPRKSVVDLKCGETMQSFIMRKFKTLLLLASFA